MITLLSLNLRKDYMARVNKLSRSTETTHGGAKASSLNVKQELVRSVAACMLWENTHYEDGGSVAIRIADLVHKNEPKFVADIAIQARSKMNLRHVPLLLVRELARHKDKNKISVSDTLTKVIQRADELTEFMAIYWKDKKDAPVSSQVKKGLAEAFTKFSAYNLAKYNRDGAIKLRDIMFLCHPKPKDKEQEQTWKDLVEKRLTPPDTWEVALSAGSDKKATWERLMQENKLGALAMLRNLRNMDEANVNKSAIKKYLETMETERVLPFRFVSASKYAPAFEQSLEKAMFKCLAQQEKLPGKTILIVDVSGSMTSSGNVSRHSEITRFEAAGALAILLREISEEIVIYATAGSDTKMIHKTEIIPPRSGFALSDYIRASVPRLGGGGIFLTQCMDYVYDKEAKADRIVVITDEQDCDQKCNPNNAKAFGINNYLMNISVETNGIGYGKWTHIDGFSESVIDFIRAFESVQGWD